MAGNAARCALELAMLDAYGRRFGKSVAEAVRAADVPGLERTAVPARVRYSGAITAETSRKVIFSDAAAAVESRVLWRPAMNPGDVVVGPAVIEEPNSTILIHPGDRVTMTPTGHLVIDLAFEA